MTLSEHPLDPTATAAHTEDTKASMIEGGGGGSVVKEKKKKKDFCVFVVLFRFRRP